MAKKYISAALGGVAESRRRLQELDSKEQARAVRWLLRWGRILAAESKRRLTWNKLDRQSGGRDRGEYANSITHEITRAADSIIQARYGSNVKHSSYVEMGTRAHFLPFKHFPQVERWARRHGLPVENMWGLAVGGKDSARPALSDAAKKYADRMASDFKRTFKK